MTNVSNSYLAWLEQEINVAEGIAIAVENGMLWFGAEVRPDEGDQGGHHRRISTEGFSAPGNPGTQAPPPHALMPQLGHPIEAAAGLRGPPAHPAT